MLLYHMYFMAQYVFILLWLVWFFAQDCYGSLSQMLYVASIYIRYVDGASCTSWIIASATWVIFSSTNEFVGLGGLFLGPATNNVVEYEAVIALLTQAFALGIHCLVVHLDS